LNHFDDILHDWFVGSLDASEMADVESHLEGCPQCRKALDSHLALFAALDTQPAENGLERLLAEATTLKRFERFTDTIAAISDVARGIATDWLARMDEAASWTETAMEGLHLFHIDGGPAVEGAIFGFVRLEPGMVFPEHTHLGEERIFVIQGGLLDENGVLHGPGSLVERVAGSTHEVSAATRVPLIYLNIVHEGLELFGMRFGPAEF
jgi:putative transcriptional regulator